MEFTFQFEPEDWTAFTVHHLKNSRLHRKQRLWVRFGVAFGFLGLGWLIFPESQRDVGVAITLGVLAVVLFFAYPIVFDGTILKRVEKAVGDPDNAKVFGRRSGTLSPAGIQVSRPGEQTSIAWDHIIKLVEAPEHLFLYTCAVEAIVIPRQTLEGASFEDVKKQVRQYVGNRASVG